MARHRGRAQKIVAYREVFVAGTCTVVVAVETAAVRVYAGLSRFESFGDADRSISMEPLKYAPSSIMMRAVVRSPTTDPSFLISMRSRARRLPFTLPYTTTRSEERRVGKEDR